MSDTHSENPTVSKGPSTKTLVAKKIVKDSLRGFPHLHEVIADGFDYKGFCDQIDQNSGLSEENKKLFKALFNPQKRIGSAFERMGRYVESLSPEYGVEKLSDDDPLREQWRGVWDDMHTKFADKISKYDAKIDAKRAKRRRGCRRLAGVLMYDYEHKAL